jgi:hypothetical protein
MLCARGIDHVYGMTIATAVGLFVIPVCYVFVQRIVERSKKPKPVDVSAAALTAE